MFFLIFCLNTQVVRKSSVYVYEYMYTDKFLLSLPLLVACIRFITAAVQYLNLLEVQRVVDFRVVLKECLKYTKAWTDFILFTQQRIHVYKNHKNWWTILCPITTGMLRKMKTKFKIYICVLTFIHLHQEILLFVLNYNQSGMLPIW